MKKERYMKENYNINMDKRVLNYIDKRIINKLIKSRALNINILKEYLMNLTDSKLKCTQFKNPSKFINVDVKPITT